MEIRDIPETTPVPGIIKILGEGCNLVANKVWLMCAPVVLDLFLLFAPKLRISDYVQPIFDTAFRQLLNTANSGAKQMEISIELLMNSLSAVNLFGFLQTYPIGVNLLLSSGSSLTPLGKSAEIQMNSLIQILAIVVITTVIGILIGTLYYSVNAAAAVKESGKFTWKKFGSQLLNVILLYIALIVLLVILSIPFSCVMTVGFLISPLIYQIIMIILIAVGCWALIPLFYIPQAIFVKGLDLPNAVKMSFKMASWSGTLTIRFILLSLVLSFGLDMIWTIPDQSSWLILISIFGHAFVSTALLSSSFVLFRELDKWQNENQRFLEWRKANMTFNKLFKKETETND